MSLELDLMNLLQEYVTSPKLDSIMVFFSRLGTWGILWILLTLIMLAFPKTRRTGVTMAIALVMEVICCNLILKPHFARIRPFEANPAVKLLVKAPKDYSFPSGHTGSSFAIASALCYRDSLLSGPAILVGTMIAISRIYLFLHYPTDVLGGVLLGVLCGWIASLITSIHLPKKKTVKAQGRRQANAAHDEAAQDDSETVSE